MSSYFENKRDEFTFRKDELKCRTLLLSEEYRKLYEEEKKFELEYIQHECSLPIDTIQSLRIALQTIGRIVNSNDCKSANIFLTNDPLNENRPYNIETFGSFGSESGVPKYLHYDIHILTNNEDVRTIVRKMLYTYEESLDCESLLKNWNDPTRTTWKKDLRGEMIVLDY